MRGLYDTKFVEEVSRAITQANVGGDILSPEEAKSFIVTTANETKLLPSCQLNLMARETKRLSAIGMLGRQTMNPGVATKGTEATVTASKNDLVAKKTLLTMRIDYEAIWNNLEGDNILATIDGMCQTNFGNDNEDLGINGDEAVGGGDPDHDFLSQQDGWIVMAKAGGRATQKLNNNGIATMAATLKALKQKVLPKYRSAPSLAFILNDEDVDTYVDELGTRIDALKYITEGLVPPYKGIPIFSLPKWPKGVQMCVPTVNLAWGVQMRVMKEMDKDIEKQQVIIVYTMLLDYNFVLDEAVAIAWDQGA
jgi:hypothetical protein